MWRDTTPAIEKDLLEKAIEFTGNAELYGYYMMKALEEYPRACEHNLSDTSINRQAWIGHAACCIALNCPEHITRKAWHYLTQEQQDKANKKADEAIMKWENVYKEKENKYKQLNLFEVTE